MVVHANQAWVTAVVDDELAKKATVLAGSLRRVLTTKKIVAVFTPNVSDEARDLLREKFDLAVLIDQPIPDGVLAEDFAKIFAFSFNIFQKCVYLSASTLVLQNCDEVFEEHKTFAAVVHEDKTVDTSVFLFTPSTRHFKAMKKIVGNGHVWKGAKSDGGNFSSYFGKWLLNQEPDRVSLNARYNQKISLMNEIEIYEGLLSDLIIVNFEDFHPMEVADKIISSSITSLGTVESYVADKWLTIYMEELKTRSCLESSEANSATQMHDKANSNEAIAIIGMSCRLPGSENLSQFEKLLLEAREGIAQLPHHRWTKDSSLLHAPDRNVQAGFLTVPVDEFDAKFFGISMKEAVFLDPQQRLLHEVTWEALEDAAVDPLSLRGTHTGIFIGSWIHDYKDIVVRMPDVDFFRMYMGNSIASGAARLSYFLGTTGPSIATESGCSSAIVAVDMALKSLRNRDSNLAIAAGVNLLIHPFDSEMLSFVVAPDGRCKTFDAKANGFGRAEGCGVLLMKRLSDAVKDGDKIWGLIRGSAVTQEGVSKSLGTPTIQCEALAMELALKDAGVEPEEVSFIETHGTGTPVGDPMEISAISKAYHSRFRTQPLVIGSVKTNVGHTESVSGITGIMKVILSMKNEIIPKHLNYSEINPEINLDLIPAIIPVEEIPWPKVAGRPRLAGVSSFGISGTDGHIIVQEPPQLTNEAVTPGFKCERPLHIMKISAKTPDSLDELLKKYQEAFKMALENDEDVSFADYAYTANVGRASFTHRAYLLAKNTEEALKILQQNSLPRREIQSPSGKLCFLFTGQGSQYPGMAQDLYKNSPVFRMSFDRCNRLLQKMYGISIKDALWSSENPDELSRTLYSQTSIFCVEYALLKLWESWGVQPEYVLGHSLGEFAASVAAGALNLKAALSLVAERSRLIDALPSGKMIVVRADKPQTDKFLKEFTSQNPGLWLDYAAVNTFDQTVLAGEIETVNLFGKFCEAKDLKTVMLAATHAFHSRHMDPMIQEYYQVASKLKAGREKDASSIGYISGMDGKLLEMDELLKPDYWTRHTREKVSFIDACKVAQAEGCTYFLEIGPHPVLCAMALSNIDGTVSCFPSLRRKQNEWDTILESVGKLFLSEWSGSFNWKGFDEFFHRKKVALPFYPFQRKKIWADVKSFPPKIHPLLGAPLQNASATSIFENSLTLKRAPYLNDHVIGSSIVFPGAGFLEMLLTGAYSHVQCLTDEFLMPRRPITLKDMKIESPLGIDDSKSTLLQVVVDLLEEEKENETFAAGYKSKVYHWHFQEDGQGHWIRHATALFLPIVTDESLLNLNVDISAIQDTWVEHSISADLYKRLPDVGLRFGPTFQSLQRGWKRAEGDQTKDDLLAEVKCPEGISNYVAHPVLVDAMIQTAMLWGYKDRIHKKLHVPVSIREFTWLRGTESLARFVYCSKTKEEGVRATLLDGNGNALMTMCGVEFVETTASVVESLISQQSSQAPVFWDEIWKHRPTPQETQVLMAKVEGQIFSDEVVQKAFELNQLDKEDKDVYTHLDGLTVIYFMNSLYELGWTPKAGDIISVTGIMSELDIVEGYFNFVRFFLRQMTQEGYLSQVDRETFRVLENLPKKAALVTALRQIVTDSEASRADFRTLSDIGRKLAEILLGKVSALSILFPDGGQMALADDFYNTLHSVVTKSCDLMMSGVISRYAKGLSELQNTSTGIIRVLEVGAGTGMHTGIFLNIIENFGIPFEYYYTDISAAFFIKAEEKFSKWKKSIIFKKLNIEEDPLLQGFAPDFFDIVIAAEVIHATRSIKETLSNLRLLTRDDGNIQILETTKQDRRFTFIFGLLEGYWRFQDFDLRQDHATLTPEQWEGVLNETGFELAIAIPCYNSVHSSVYAIASSNYYPNGMYRRDFVLQQTVEPVWLVFGDDSFLCNNVTQRVSNLGRKVITLNRRDYNEDTLLDKAYFDKLLSLDKERKFEGVIYFWGLVGSEEKAQKNISKPYLCLCQYLWENQKLVPKVFTVTCGIQSVEQSLDGLQCVNPASGTLVGMTKVLRTEASLPTKCIDISPNIPVDDQANQLFSQLWHQEDHEDVLAFRGGKRYVPRLATMKLPNESLILPKGTDRFQLTLPQTRLISDLQFGFLNCYTLEDTEMEVKVKACALNFRDVFAVLKPDPQFDNINAIGTDFAGVVSAVGPNVTKWKVGDAVFGCNLNDNQALPSHIKVKEDTVVPLPEYFTFAEGCTLPAVFSTAFYCLVTVAKIKKSDTVLIHTASGGVGLSAIQIAQHFGAKIIATAGSERKRTFLRNLGIQHVFHSRNTKFGDQILEVTDGRGVDIVLNSLTSEGFKEATLKSCAKHARFVEMSKLNVWQPEEVQQLREDVDYTIADLTTLKEPVWRELFDQMKKFIEGGVVKAIPYVGFDGVNIRAALNYLQKAKHIGKVVCTMPEVKLENSKFTSVTPLFNDRSTYLITGGLGGIGLEVAKWMVTQGARHLVLVGRSKPNEKAQQLLNDWQEMGYNVNAWSVDVGDFAQCHELIRRIKDPQNGLPPLRGVMHAAGTLSDGTYPNQTWEKFEHTFNAKVDGSWNLHSLTLDCPLEHFVFFSSLAALFGTPGQANHSAGNFYEDALARYRNSIGLPATTINWGPWGQVGVATDIEIPGFKPLSTAQGLLGLDMILRQSRQVQTCVLIVDSFSLFAKFCPGIKNYIDNQSLFSEIKGPVFNLSSDEFWEDVDSVEDREEKEEIFRKYIKLMVRTILKMEPDENIDDTAEFQTLGVDSLMMLEMKNSLQTLFGNRMTLSASDLKGCNTAALLASKLVDILLASSAAGEVFPTMDELKLLIQEDAHLERNISANSQNPVVSKPSDIRTVLLTGATGMLAPHLLKHLAKMDQISRIVCIIRKRGKLSPEERLISTLQNCGVYDDNILDKVESYEGDVGQPRFGLSEELYNSLAESIDCIIHCAAKVDHLQRYRRTQPQEKFHIRHVNVLGTKNVLSFASQTRTKMVLHCSTFAAIYSINKEMGSLSEEFESGQIDHIPFNNGYTISKYLAEQLIKHANSRGIPCKSFRLPFIAGDSETGWHEVRGNHLMLRFLTYMKVGACPGYPVVPIVMLPVDYCAELTMRLFFDDQTPCDVYNIVPRTPELEQEFSVVAEEFGYPVELVEYEQFLEKIKALGDKSPISAFMEHYEDVEFVKKISSSPAVPSMEHWISEDIQTYFYSGKLDKYCPDLYSKMMSPLEAVKRDLLYLKKSGIFDKFGL